MTKIKIVGMAELFKNQLQPSRAEGGQMDGLEQLGGLENRIVGAIDFGQPGVFAFD